MAPDGQERPTPSHRIWSEAALAIVIPTVVVAGIYLAPFVRDRATMPFGFDVSGYVFHLNVVHDLGIGAPVERASVLGQRPGYPVVLSLLRSATGMSALTIMWIVPALMAAALGLAAGGLAADASLVDRRRTFVVAIAVGGSAFVAWTAVGYATNLALDVVAVAVMAMAIRVARGERGTLAGAVLIGGGAILHWMFAILAAALVGAFAVAAVLDARVRKESDAPVIARRLGLMLLGGIGLALAGAALSPTFPGGLPRINRGPGSAAFIAERLPTMALPVTVPLAAAGAWLLLARRDSAGRQSAILLGGWGLLAVAGPFTWYVLHLPLPPYRWAGFALGIPLLISIGALAARTRLIEHSGWGRRLAGALLLLAAGVGLAWPGAAVWWTRDARVRATELAQAGTLGSYLAGVPAHTPIVLVVGEHRRAEPIAGLVRGGLPIDRVPDVRVVPGRIDPGASDLGLGAGIVGSDPNGTVVVEFDAYLPRPATAGRLLGPGVHLFAGPAPGAVTPVPPPRAPSAAALAWLTAASLAVLALAGLGWALGLGGLPPIGAVAMAPAFGIALLGPIGLVSSLLGVSLAGAGGIAILAVTALSGAAVAALRRARTRPV